MLLKHLDALSGEFRATPAGKPASQRPALRVFLPGKALLMGEVGGGKGGGERGERMKLGSSHARFVVALFHSIPLKKPPFRLRGGGGVESMSPPRERRGRETSFGKTSLRRRHYVERRYTTTRFDQRDGVTAIPKKINSETLTRERGPSAFAALPFCSLPTLRRSPCAAEPYCMLARALLCWLFGHQLFGPHPPLISGFLVFVSQPRRTEEA